MSLLKRTKEFIIKEQLIAEGDIVLLAVSGGMDSMALAHLLLALQSQLGFSLAIANFNHHLRPEAAEEAKFVEAFADSHDVPFFAGEADIAALAEGGNIQETARRERYAYLRSLAAKLEANSIAVAHHGDDQAETVLLHLLRGSGLAGLGGMSAKNGNIIRPFLFARRKQIEEFVEQNHIEYKEDISNASVKYLRNKIRLQLLPCLKEYNPQICETLTATAAICREENMVLDDLAANALAELWLNDKNALDKEGFRQLPVALQRRVLRKAYTMVMGEKMELNFEQVESILCLKDEQSAVLPGGGIVYLRENICFGEEKPELPEYNGTYPLLIDRQWHRIGELPWQYCAAETPCPPEEQDLYWLAISAAEAKNLSWRTRRLGDYVISLGKTGKTKLKEIFIENHIPVFERNSWPVLTSDQDIVWVAGLWKTTAVADKNPILIKIRAYDRM